MLQANRRIKRYVSVTTRVDEDGKIRPLSIQWYDGTTFPIDEVRSSQRVPSMHAGGLGTRYTVRIGSTVTQLYFEDPRWYVEEVTQESAARKDRARS